MNQEGLTSHGKVWNDGHRSELHQKTEQLLPLRSFPSFYRHLLLYPQCAALGKFSAGTVYLISPFQGILSLGKPQFGRIVLDRLNSHPVGLDLAGAEKLSSAFEPCRKNTFKEVSSVDPTHSHRLRLWSFYDSWRTLPV